MHLTLDETWAPLGGRVPAVCPKCFAPYHVGHGYPCRFTPKYPAVEGDIDRSTGFDGTYATFNTTADLTDTRKTQKTHGNAEGI